jgi:hypothetical protein
MNLRLRYKGEDGMKRICLIMLPLVICTAIGCQDHSAQIEVPASQNRDEVSNSTGTSTPDKQEADGSAYWDRVTTLYENAKASGETSADSVHDWISELYETAKLSGESTADDTSEWVKGLYKQAREAGEISAASAKNWIEDDIQKIGSWQYKTLEVRQTDSVDIVPQLNKLGADRWECFWVEQQDDTTTFYLKKAGRSYLRHLPSKDLIRLLPILGGAGGTPE